MSELRRAVENNLKYKVNTEFGRGNYMSICAIISNPQNKEEEQLYIAIAAESVFKQIWLPIIKELDLKWVACFQSGVEIEKQDSSEVIHELELMLDWINKAVNGSGNNTIKVRIRNLIKNINELCIVDDRVIYIG